MGPDRLRCLPVEGAVCCENRGLRGARRREWTGFPGGGLAEAKCPADNARAIVFPATEVHDMSPTREILNSLHFQRSGPGTAGVGPESRRWGARGALKVGLGVVLGLALELGGLLGGDSRAGAQESQDNPPAAPPVVAKPVEVEALTRDNLKRLEELRSEPVQGISISWRPDGKELLIPLSPSGQEGVQIRDAETLEVLGTTAAGRRVYQLFFNPKLPQAVMVTFNSGVEMINTETGDGFQFDDLGRGSTVGVSFRPDGKQVALGGMQGSLFLVDTTTGEKQHALELKERGVNITPVYSRDGKRIAVNPPRGPIRIWDTETGELVREIDAQQSSNGVMCLFDRAGERLLTLHLEGKAALWKIEDGSAVWKRDIHQPEDNPILALRWLAEGTVLAGIGSGTVAFFDPEELKLLHELEAPTRAYAFGVSPDGRRLLLLGRNDSDPTNTLVIWGVPKSPAESPAPAAAATPAPSK